MAAATRLTTKGQLVIPKAVRERLRWVAGTELAVEEVGTGALRLLPLETADPIDRLYGCLRTAPRDPLVELEAEHCAEVEVGRMENAPIISGDPEILALPAAVIRTRKLERNA